MSALAKLPVEVAASCYSLPGHSSEMSDFERGRIDGEDVPPFARADMDLSFDRRRYMFMDIDGCCRNRRRLHHMDLSFDRRRYMFVDIDGRFRNRRRLRHRRRMDLSFDRRRYMFVDIDGRCRNHRRLRHRRCRHFVTSL
ncbi:hypothetical protein KSP39_PZI019215 [Platanthera zijinensis]|uniref:Uncharacterized protein n=1 Tax=Platanthera zijinensis TaxID=2320716 RepID=A0AAP0FXK6_9ASPA